LTELELPAHYRRNFLCLATDFGFFGIAMAFIGPSTVIPSFLSALGASSAMIGLMTTLQRAGWFLPQLFAARQLGDKPYKKPYVVAAAGISRFLVFVLAIMLGLIDATPRLWLVPLTLLVFTAFWAGDGIGSVAWFDLLSKTIPPRRRGRLTGVGQTISGVFGFLAGFVVEWLLSVHGPAFPQNYASLFLIGFGLLTVSTIAIASIVEPKSVSSRDAPSWREFMPKIWAVMRDDVVFRRYIIARQFYNLHMLAVPFYMTYALDRLGLPAQVAGRYTSIGVVGTVLSALIFTWLNEHHGTKLAIQIDVVFAVLLPLTALVIPTVVTDIRWLAWVYGLVFFMMNATTSGVMPGWLAYMLEVAPEAERPVYVGLTNTLNGVTMLFSALGGLILAWTGNNYGLLFAITLVGTTIAWPMTLALHEPREAHGAS
jgi:MFS family permease